MARLDPSLRVVRHAERLTPQNAAEVVGGYDLVLDGSDTFETRYLVNDALVAAGRPWVWGAVLRFDGHVSVFDPAGATYRDLFPTPPPPGSVPGCGEAGVLGGVCAAVASVMVTEAVKLITGAGRPLTGRVLVHDALAMTWRELPLRPDPRRSVAVVLPAVTAEDLLRDGARTVVDVREPHEHAAGAVPGSVLLPLADLLADPGRLPAGPVVLHCARGGRSAEALRAVLATGRSDVVHLDGGFAAWCAAGGPVV